MGRSTPLLNENALHNLLADVDFLKEELTRIGRAHLDAAFDEFRTVRSMPLMLCDHAKLCATPRQLIAIVLGNKVQEYLTPSARQSVFLAVKPKRLQALLEKLAKYGASVKDSAEREKGEKRRKEAETVGRLFPGESRS